jgi:rhodanese-related sulfurtransferase
MNTKISKFLSYVLLPMLLWGIGNPILSAQMVLNPKFDKKIKATIEQTVPTISCKVLHKKIEAKTPKLYILDARELEEYKVSHLPQAIHVGYDHFKTQAVKSLPKDAILVVYCSIGYRSEKIGEKLKSMGFSRIYNLYGGIFEWSNRAYPLENEQRHKTKKVHTYNKDWSRWLDKGEKVY